MRAILAAFVIYLSFAVQTVYGLHDGNSEFKRLKASKAG